MMKPLDFVRKLFRIRKRLIREGVSRKGSVNKEMLWRLEVWVKHADKAPDEVVIKQMVRYREVIDWLIPGEGAGCSEKLNRELEAILGDMAFGRDKVDVCPSGETA